MSDMEKATEAMHSRAMDAEEVSAEAVLDAARIMAGIAAERDDIEGLSVVLQVLGILDPDQDEETS